MAHSELAYPLEKVNSMMFTSLNQSELNKKSGATSNATSRKVAKKTVLMYTVNRVPPRESKRQLTPAEYLPMVSNMLNIVLKRKFSHV